MWLRHRWWLKPWWIGRLGADEELDVAEGEGCGDGVGAAGAVFT